MAPGVGGGGGQPAPSPAHTGDRGGVAQERSGGHRGVQRSISATSGNKPRRGSTGGAQSETASNTAVTAVTASNTTSESGPGSQAGPGDQGATEAGQGLLSMIGPFHVCVLLVSSVTQKLFEVF